MLAVAVAPMAHQLRRYNLSCCAILLDMVLSTLAIIHENHTVWLKHLKIGAAHQWASMAALVASVNEMCKEHSTTVHGLMLMGHKVTSCLHVSHAAVPPCAASCDELYAALPVKTYGAECTKRPSLA